MDGKKSPVTPSICSPVLVYIHANIHAKSLGLGVCEMFSAEASFDNYGRFINYQISVCSVPLRELISKQLFSPSTPVITCICYFTLNTLYCFFYNFCRIDLHLSSFWCQYIDQLSNSWPNYRKNCFLRNFEHMHRKWYSVSIYFELHNLQILFALSIFLNRQVSIASLNWLNLILNFLFFKFIKSF